MEWDPNKNPGRAPIGGKPKRKNQKVQAKANVESKKRAEAESSAQATNELTFQEMFMLLGIIETIVKDWSVEDGEIISDIIDQNKRDICWAICFARLVQALYNIGRPVNQHVQFSIAELLDHIKPGESENFELANLKIAFDHIADKGILKEPTTSNKSQKANAQGMRVQKTFHLYENVDADFIQARLNRYPVALIVQVDADFLSVGKEGIYHLPKKQPIAEDTRLHCMLLIGYGVTKDGKTFFIGQNSYGESWGCKGYAIIIIDKKCDIFCQKDHYR
ncbi:unnamed protein product [Arabidopsis halleri]